MEPPRWRDTFISMRSHNYRLYVISQLLANTSGWMQRIATDWLVLELTGSVAMVGLTVALQFTPILVLGAYGGVISDRYNKRIILICTQSSAAIFSGILAVLALTGTAQVWHVFALVAALGFVAVIDGPARAAFVTEMVGHSRLRNAISVNASIFHLGGLVGPALAGVLIALAGPGWAIAANSVAAMIVAIAFASMRTAELGKAPHVAKAKGQIREALNYVLAKPAILWSLVTLSFVSVFGMSLPILLAGMANSVHDSGSAGYGLYSSLVAAGALVGALASTRRRILRLRTIVISALIYGILQALAGFAPVYVMFLMLLPTIGLARLLFATAVESMTQLSSNHAIRGRVMSIFTMVVVGGQAIGGPLMGWLAEHYGPATAMVVSGVVPAVAALVIATVLARTGNLTIRVSLRRKTRLVMIVPRSAKTQSV